MDKKKIWKFILLIQLVFISFYSNSKWIQVTGKSLITSSEEEAREKAIKKAIKEASFKAGFSIQQTEKIEKGILKESTFTVAHKGSFASAEILSETVDEENETYEVLVNLQIDKERPRCANNLKAGVLLAKTKTNHLEQLRYGNIFDLPDAISKKISIEISDKAKHFFTIDHNVNISTDRMNKNKISTWIAKERNAQYVIFSQIIDISIETGGLIGAIIPMSKDREFKIHFALYHGISGEKIWENIYRKRSKWEFSLNEQVDPNSNFFWSSSFGKSVQQVLTEAIKDMDILIRCKVTSGQVIAKKKNYVIINLGRRNLVKSNDKFQIIAVEGVKDRNNQMKLMPKMSTAEISISNVTEFYSTAVLKKETASLNVQIGDMAVKINQEQEN